MPAWFPIRCFALLALSASLAPAEPKIAARFYYVEDTLASLSLQAHAAELGALSPVWFTVDVNGGLRTAADPKLIKFAADKKLPLLPVVVNVDFKPEAVQAAVSGGIRDQLIQALTKEAADAKFSGLELDFEEVPASLKDGYTTFVRRLAEALHKRKMTLGIAVPAPLTPGSPPNVPVPAWTANPRAAAFDYAQLANAADSITLMAYDEYTAADSPGPVAGLPWVEACVRQAVSSAAPQKLLLGLALYYRHWNGATVTEGPFPVARALAAKSGVAMSLNKLHQEMTFGFTEGSAKHVVWGEDAGSLAARFALIGKYKLGGYAAWRLGQEDPSAWTTVFSSRTGRK